MPELFVLIVGDPADGITLYGPFTHGDLATEYADAHFRNETWWVTDLRPAEGDSAYPPPFVVIDKDTSGGDPVVVGPFLYESDAVKLQQQGPDRHVTQLWSSEQYNNEEHFGG